MVTIIFLFVMTLIVGVLLGGDTFAEAFYKGVGCFTWLFFILVGLLVLIVVLAE